MMTTTRQSENGDVPLKQETILLPNEKAEEFVIEAPQSLTFEAELAALMEKHQVQLVPYIIKFNNGNELADAKFMSIQK